MPRGIRCRSADQSPITNHQLTTHHYPLTNRSPLIPSALFSPFFLFSSPLIPSSPFYDFIHQSTTHQSQSSPSFCSLLSLLSLLIRSYPFSCLLPDRSLFSTTSSIGSPQSCSSFFEKNPAKISETVFLHIEIQNGMLSQAFHFISE